MAATSLLVLGSSSRALAALPPYPTNCPAVAYPTSSTGYGIPIRNQIINGVLTQGTSKITQINASICGLLQFPSLSAAIPASDITFGVADATVAGLVSVGTVDISAVNGPNGYSSAAVTSQTPAPDGGLVFTLTADTANVINISLNLPVVGGLLGGLTLVSCNTNLTATFDTAESANSKPLTGPLADGAAGVAYAPDGKVTISGLTPHDPSSVADQVGCPIVGTALGVPTSTTASFQAPITFYSTLTSF